MAADFAPVPRRGTPAFRAWLVRALLVGALPIVTMLVGVATVRIFDLAQNGDASPWTELSGWMLGACVLLGVVALVALFDRRTRLSGALALVAALVVNPLSSALILGMVGL